MALATKLDQLFDQAATRPDARSIASVSREGRRVESSVPTVAGKNNLLLETLPSIWRDRARVDAAVADHVKGFRSAVYTRYSTRNQYESSTERQIEACEKYAQRFGFSLVEDGVYSDEERSGGYMFGRERLRALLERAAAGELDCVMIEDASRLSRDMVDLGWLWRQLKRWNVQLHATTRGLMGAVDIAVYGFLNQEQRQTILANTSWGRRKMVAEGRVPWGKLYGYRRVMGSPGTLEIDPDQCPVVKRIFKLCLEGIPQAHIARLLNAENEPGPTGRRWMTASIRKMLSNPLYRGLLIYGRLSHGIDPDTGKRFKNPRSEDDWLIKAVPELSIIEAEVWDSAQVVGKKPPYLSKVAKGPRPTFLLSELVFCPECGEKLIVMGTTKGTIKRRFGCSSYFRDRSCANGRSWYMRWIETGVLNLLCEELDRPEFYRAYLHAVNVESKSAFLSAASKREGLEKRVSKLRTRMSATFDEALTRGMSTTSTVHLRSQIEQDLMKAEEMLAALPRRSVDIDVEAELGRIGDLAHALRDLAATPVLDTASEHGLRLKAAIRALIDRVVIAPDPCSMGIEIRLTMQPPIHARAALDGGPVALPILLGTYVPPSCEDRRLERGRREAMDLIASGDCSLDDATWASIKHLVPMQLCRHLDGERRDGRALVDLMLLVSKLRRSTADVPSEFGSHRQVVRAYKAFARLQDWDRVLEAIGVLAPHLRDGMRPSALRSRNPTGGIKAP